MLFTPMRVLAFAASLALLLLLPLTAFAAEAPQLAWPGQTGDIIKRITPVVALLIVVVGLYSIVSSAFGAMGQAAGGGRSVRAAIMAPFSVTIIALITIVFLYGFLDILNAVLTWIYSFL